VGKRFDPRHLLRRPHSRADLLHPAAKVASVSSRRNRGAGFQPRVFGTAYAPMFLEIESWKFRRVDSRFTLEPMMEFTTDHPTSGLKRFSSCLPKKGLRRGITRMIGRWAWKCSHGVGETELTPLCSVHAVSLAPLADLKFLLREQEGVQTL
jgi:hypothetical protein